MRTLLLPLLLLWVGCTGISVNGAAQPGATAALSNGSADFGASVTMFLAFNWVGSLTDSDCINKTEAPAAQVEVTLTYQGNQTTLLTDNEGGISLEGTPDTALEIEVPNMAIYTGVGGGGGGPPLDILVFGNYPYPGLQLYMVDPLRVCTEGN